jgi:hypothetical protein
MTTLTAREVFRAYETDGVPASGAHKPIKEDIVEYLTDRVEIGGIGVPVASRTELKTFSSGIAYLKESGREGNFIFMAGNYSTQIAVDTQEGIYVKATAVASSAGAWVRIYAVEMKAEWFGAVGDGATDSTAALNAAAIASKGAVLALGRGVFLTDGMTFAPGVATPWKLRGAGPNATAIRKRTATSSVTLTVGQSTSPAYLPDISIEDITIDGFNGTAAAALRLYDVWKSSLKNVRCDNAIIGLDALTTIFLSGDHVVCDYNQIGLNIDDFAGSSFAGGRPAVIGFSNSQFQNNSKRGIKADSLDQLVLNACAIEFNGTTIATADEGGLWMGPDTGATVSSFATGLTAVGCWFESTKGIADAQFEGGQNTLLNCEFLNPLTTYTTHDVRIVGGRYQLQGCTAANTKVANVKEESGALSGNLIIGCQMGVLSVDATKTGVNTGTRLTIAEVRLPSPTGGLGYGTGAGGTVTQATSKSTGVTLNKVCGEVTMNAAALAAGAIVSFVLTDSAIAAGDRLVLNHVSGGTLGAYGLNAACAAGSATIYVRNNTGGSLSEAIVIGFALIKAVTA